MAVNVSEIGKCDEADVCISGARRYHPSLESMSAHERITKVRRACHSSHAIKTLANQVHVLLQA